MKTITIKVNDEATEEKVVRLIKEYEPELLEDNMRMCSYYRVLRSYSEYWNEAGCLTQYDKEIAIRIRALLKIWEWKEENDGAFGWEEVLSNGISKYQVIYDCEDEEFRIDFFEYCVCVTELPYFSRQQIAKRALKELEAEYKVVFNVK